MALLPFFYRGTDFTFPIERRDLREALDNAYRSGCLIFMGVADNRGRRAAVFPSALKSVIAVGSTNRKGEKSDIASSSDYTEIAAPGGQRGSSNPYDHIWSTGGSNNFVHMDGGCMAAGFAGAVAALIWSRYPSLRNDQVRQILRNTARGEGWNPFLGHGIIDAYRAVTLRKRELTRRLRIEKWATLLQLEGSKFKLKVEVKNLGVYDADNALIVAYNGNPLKAASKKGSMRKPVILITRQIGHTIVSVTGFESNIAELSLDIKRPPAKMYLQVFSLDIDSEHIVSTVRVNPILRL
ncbi:hypothetical protein CW702_00595 [Candidatus Bathyarchaeota archaeon]|nr:MAG: hypothetical protein CW702_00595 [Candidatus Bathyarchaeota archaeon]